MAIAVTNNCYKHVTAALLKRLSNGRFNSENRRSAVLVSEAKPPLGSRGGLKIRWGF
jgi:hypothetical protein